MRPISMRKISEVLRQHHVLKCSRREIARSLNICKTTVCDYIDRAHSAGIRWPLPADLSEEDLYNQLFPPIAAQPRQRPLPEWAHICQELRRKGVTLRLLWLEYLETHPDGLRYSQFCTHYRQWVKATSPVMRQVHKAGEKAFVDYAGMTLPWIDPSTGEIHEAQIFVGSLGASQFTFAEATASQQIPDWVQSHVRMWEFFGGVTRVVVPDNLKTGVDKAHRYDPDVNASYQRLGEHYGFAIVPARVRTPKDKAKVENAVGCIEKQVLAPLRDRTFTGIAEINEAMRPLVTAFNLKSFQKMALSRQELFESVDKPALQPLPPDRYQHDEWSKGKVHIDYHVSFDKHHYSVPYQHIHKTVDIRATAKTVEIYLGGKRIASHPRSHQKYRHSTLREHMPAAHKAHAEWSPERMKRWAEKIGPQTVQCINAFIKARAFPEQAYRACLGILRLGTRYGEDRLEKACAIAFDAGATRYRDVELILKNNLDKVPPSKAVSSPVMSSHGNIRGSDYYNNP